MKIGGALRLMLGMQPRSANHRASERFRRRMGIPIGRRREEAEGTMGGQDSVLSSSVSVAAFVAGNEIPRFILSIRERDQHSSS
ncbi:MAG TPA: hypothetical protein VKD65_16470 [Candidatus Angelobacter sp.]|nr:hypothetical protein [Candidatus Angelobacter sp.]